MPILIVTAVDHTTGILTSVAHGKVSGDGPGRLYNPNGALPSGWTTANSWFIRVDADHFKLADSNAHALAGTAIALPADDGTGALKVLVGIPFTRSTTYANGSQVKSADLDALQDALPVVCGPWVHGAASWRAIANATVNTPLAAPNVASVDITTAGGSAYAPLPEAVPGMTIGSIDCVVKSTAPGTHVTVALMRQKYDGSAIDNVASVVAVGASAWAPATIAANHPVAAGYAYYLTVTSDSNSGQLLMATVVPG